MMDRVSLLVCGAICSVLAWGAWHWWGGDFTFAFFVIVLLGYAVDNFQLRKQVRGLLAERERREKKNALRSLMASLMALREKNGRGL